MTQDQFRREIETACSRAAAAGLLTRDVSFVLHAVAAEIAPLHIPVEDRLPETLPDLKSLFAD